MKRAKLLILALAFSVLTLGQTAFAASWTTVGPAGSLPTGTSNTDMAMDSNGVPYVLSVNGSGAGVVHKLVGSDW